MTIKITNIQHKFRNKYIKYAAGTSDNISSVSSNNVENKFDNYFYEDEAGNLHSRLSFVGDKEISAYGVGDDSGTGSITIIDNLLSNAVDCALSANQGRVLNEKIEDIIEQGVGGVTSWNDLEDKPALLTDENIQKWNTQTHTHSNKTVLDGITSAKTTNWDSAYTHISDTTKHITSAERTSWNNKLDKSVWDKAFYYDSDNNLRVKVNVVGEKEISAYGIGESGGSGAITIVDNLTSTQTDCALSANQGRILKGLIDDKVSTWDDLEGKPSWIGSTKPSYSWSEITGKPSTFTPSEHTHNYTSTIKIGSTSYNVSANTVSLPAYPTLTDLGGVSTSTFNSHTGNTTLHITSTERTNWNTAYNNNHTHSNKSVLDGITSTKVGNWDGVVTNWNKAFYFDSNNNLRVKLNLVGEGEVSAYGAGTSGTGIITIVDNLTSTATDCALSANQGRVLKGLIDSKVSSWNDIKDKPSTFTPSTHTHNYASTVKVGSTNYNVNSNIISLPAYPTTLKNPNALTISLNGTSQGAYDGSAAKSINITASSIGAAASSHTHTISQITNLQSTLDSKLNSSAYTAADVLSKLKTVDGSGSGLDADLLDGLHASSFSKINDFSFTANTLVEDWVKSNSATQRAGNIFSVNGWAWSNDSTLKLTDSISITKMRYSALSIRNGDLRGSWQQQALMFIPTYSDSSMIYLAQMNTNNTASDLQKSLKRYADYDTIINGNVASATKLQTPRTIWGQSFDGTKDVSGNMTNVGNITTVSNIQPIWTLVNANGSSSSISRWADRLLISSTNAIHLGVGDNGNGNYDLLISKNHYVGIGTYSPSVRLDVNGNARAERFISTIPTGIAPLSVNSTTLVNNLNADRLDGYNYSSFESYQVVVIDASNLNNNTWYPVTMNIGNSLQTRIRIEGSTSANASWNSRSDKTMALILDYTVNGSQYGWTSVQRVIHTYIEGAGTSNCLRGIGQLTNSSTEYVFVRGGAKYNFYVSRFITPVLRTSTYTVTSQSVSPTTTMPAAITRNNALITDNVASATRLQTARTLWGQSFNGTANVSGNMTGVGSISASGNIVAGGEITAYSDKRLKSNIQILEDRGYITPVTYIKDGKQSIGFLAQEVREKYPELVTEDTNEEKYLSLNYAQYTAVLQAQIIELNNRIKQLESKL